MAVVLAFLFIHDGGVFPSAGTTDGTGVLIGNLFGQTGALGGDVLAGARPELYPSLLWTALEIVAVVSAVVGLVALGAALGAGGRGVLQAIDLRRRDSPLGSTLGMLAAFAVIYALETIIFGLNASTHDRYLWSLGLPLAVLLLWRQSRPATVSIELPRSSSGRDHALHGPAAWLAGAMLFGTGLLSLTLLLNAMAYDVARWRIAEAQMANGTPAMSIDAGIEWLGYHATDVADLQAPAPVYSEQYTRLWASYRECVVVSNSRLDRPGLSLADVSPATYRQFLFVGQPMPLYVYRSSAAGCCPRRPDRPTSTAALTPEEKSPAGQLVCFVSCPTQAASGAIISGHSPSVYSRPRAFCALTSAVT